ncbi:putative Nascent polypeptide-associated complex subunit alpha [Blattamonas nauphoetae]|uniref:Nascent polypeptide-associated complex subunit alpha n=1 Tax=Blattamonas nauphoetae TaxID=2049346 RepID=A0ABQ9XHJ3_9EUKA|nr:putative Nascent polypeptide-associated complex subunit alpha [Blattamonas nauphoetae]
MSQPTDNKPTDDMPSLEPATDIKDGSKPHVHGPDCNHDHDHDHDHAHDDSKQSKGEKKARKAAKNLGLKQMTDIATVTIRNQRTPIFTIQNPDVFATHNKDGFIVFGNLRMDDMQMRAQQQAADQFKPSADGQGIDQAQLNELVNQITKEANAGADTKAAAASGAKDEDVDTSGVTEDDINIVMQQANCTKKEAVDALRAANNDYIQAIISLTK